ncbi:SDR family oxidoreductase [Microseira sp. BLCC-F43]|jgi:dTDP-4-dehydrorhamnose reductase|uniref:SDR family oxidoreductase n=1 Tax=Microseira sp. BLCC-F43 TaxID=3153602 RepID=UPI0035B84024
MIKILITGGSGFVGSNLARFFAKRKSVFVSKLSAPIAADLLSSVAQPVSLDVRDANAVFTRFEEVLPEVVIHAAGNKNVKYCENHPDEAYETNAIGTKNVARACRNIGARMIYISTDLVFSCTDGGYKETDVPQPSLVYGKTKLQGEELAQQELDKVAICRSGGIYGKASPLLKWLSAQIEAGQTVECFADVLNTPTYVNNLAEMIEVIIQQRLSGIFHTVGRERVSRFQFFHSYASIFGLNTELISPVEAGDRREQMLLQPDASLSIEQTSAILGVNFNSVTEGLSRLKLAGGV